jgi:pimeloyl-ACP methyl ester carboxylesterase
VIASIVLATTFAARPLVIMIHGAGGGGWEYRSWKPVFEKAGYRVEAPDLVPAAGGLAKTTVEDYVRQIVRVAGHTPAILVGASMGGVLVLKAAEQIHPKAIVLVCSALPAINTREDRKQEPYPDIVRWRGGPYKDTVDSMPDSDETTRKYAWPRWRDESGQVLNAIRAGVQVSRPACPVLSVIPGADDTVPPAQQLELANWCHADAVRFQGMSHVGPLLSRRREEVARMVATWLVKIG